MIQAPRPKIAASAASKERTIHRFNCVLSVERDAPRRSIVVDASSRLIPD